MNHLLVPFFFNVCVCLIKDVVKAPPPGPCRALMVTTPPPPPPNLLTPLISAPTRLTVHTRPARYQQNVRYAISLFNIAMTI